MLVCTYVKFLPGWDCYKSTYVKYDIVLRYHVTGGLHNLSTEDKRLGPKCVRFHCNNLYPSPICLLTVPPSPNNYIVPSHFVPSITLHLALIVNTSCPTLFFLDGLTFY